MAITDAQRQMARKVLSNTTGRLLRRGSKGVSVRALQAFLADNGYDVGRLDGIFGKRTQAALKAFQKDSGIRVDGKAGSQTFGKVREKMPDAVEPVASADLAPMEAMEPEAPAEVFGSEGESPEAFLDRVESGWGVEPMEPMSHIPPVTEEPAPAPMTPEEVATQTLRENLPAPTPAMPSTPPVGQFQTPQENPRFDPANRTFDSVVGNPNMDPMMAALLGRAQRPPTAMGASAGPNISMNDMIRALTMGR